MTLRDRLFAAFHAVATGTRRLDAGAADSLASHVAHANEGIHVVGSLCTSASALQANTLAVMLERWFRLLPEYEGPRQVLLERPGKAATVAQIDPATAAALQARVLSVCVEERGLPEPQAAEVANHVRDAASAFWALEQCCRAPERRTQRALCGALRAALGEPLTHAEAAARLFLQERPAPKEAGKGPM
jgi:hypothetical protein